MASITVTHHYDHIRSEFEKVLCLSSQSPISKFKIELIRIRERREKEQKKGRGRKGGSLCKPLIHTYEALMKVFGGLCAPL